MKAQEVSCLNNTKQLGLGMFMYVTDNNGTHINSQTVDWMTLLEPYNVSTNNRICPATTVKTNTYTQGFGSADTAWDTTGDLGYYSRGSYGMNGFCYSRIYWPASATLGSATNDIYPYISSFTDPSRTPYFADAVWVGGYPVVGASSALSAAGNDLYYGPFATSGSMGTRSIGRFIILRHGSSGTASPTSPLFTGTIAQLPGLGNMGFGDGHAEGKKLLTYWNLKWSKAWP